MKVALSIEVTDPQRNRLARLTTPSAAKRLATRDEVRDFLLGAIGALDDTEPEASAPAEPPTTPKPTHSGHGAGASVLSIRDMTAAENAQAKKLLAQGHSPSYVTGWIKAGRMLKTTGKSQ